VSVLESKRTDYRGKAVLEPCSDKALVSNVFLNLKKTERLTEQLTTTIGSVFCAHEAVLVPLLKSEHGGAGFGGA
jgi:hypothetical protein